jgi:mannose-6-phosphate isomerase-like protein (cupin superfamily)
LAEAQLSAWNIDHHLRHRAERTNINVAFVDGAYVMRIAQLRDTFPPHRHDSDESWFVYRGRMRVDSDIGQAELGPGDGVVVPTGIRHSVTCLEAGTTVLIVNRKGQQTVAENKDEFEAAGAVDIDASSDNR